MKNNIYDDDEFFEAYAKMSRSKGGLKNAEVYHHVYQTLKPNGVFLFNMEHPIFTSGVNQQWVTDGEKNFYCLIFFRHFMEWQICSL